MRLAWIYQLDLYVDAIGMADFAHSKLSDAFCVLMLPVRHAVRMIKKARNKEKTRE